MHTYFQFVLCATVLAAACASKATEKRQADKEAESPPDYQQSSPSFLRFASKNGQPLRYQQAVAYVPQEALRYSQAPSQLSYGFLPQQLEQGGQHAAQPASAPRYVTAGKETASSQPSQALTFSPASEVSSFRFSSPLVTYSNLGVLRQVVGKTEETEVDASSAQTAQPASAPQKSAPAQQSLYANALQQAYSSAYLQPQKASSPKFAYALVPQKASYAQAPQQQYVFSNELQQPVYSAGPQKLVYAAQPQYLSQKPTYVATPSRYVSGLPQQVQYASGQQEGAQQFALAYAPQSAQHTVPQRVYAYPQYQLGEQAASRPQKEDSSGDEYSQ